MERIYVMYVKEILGTSEDVPNYQRFAQRRIYTGTDYRKHQYSL